jgi:peptidyl-prolyl cis-trans isomerase C
MINFKNVMISLLAVLMIANFASAFGKKKPKDAKPAAETKATAKEEVKKEEPKTEAAPAAPAVSAPVAPAPAAPAPAPAKEVKESAPVTPTQPIIEMNEPAKKAIDPNAVVATVNGTKITEGQIAKILDARLEQLASRIPPNMKDQYRQTMRKRLVEQMVIEQVLTEKEKAANITVSAADVNEKIAEQMKEQNLTTDEFKALLKNYGTSYSEFEQNMRKKLAFEKLMDGEFKNKIKEPNEAAIKAFYDENADQFKEPESIHAKHILIKPEDGNDPNKAKAAAKAKAEEVMKKVKDGGNFEELAKEYSACPSAKNGGDLGDAPKGSFVPEFEKAAYALEPNQVSDIVETEFGYHIIKLVSHKQANVVSLESAKEKISQHLTNQQKEQVVLAYIKQIKNEADIKFTDPNDNFEIPEAKQAPARPAAPAAPTTDKTEPNTAK